MEIWQSLEFYLKSNGREYSEGKNQRILFKFRRWYLIVYLIVIVLKVQLRKYTY